MVLELKSGGNPEIIKCNIGLPVTEIGPRVEILRESIKCNIGPLFMSSQWIFIYGQWKCERRSKTTKKDKKGQTQKIHAYTFINHIELQT